MDCISGTDHIIPCAWNLSTSDSALQFGIDMVFELPFGRCRGGYHETFIPAPVGSAGGTPLPAAVENC